MRARILGLLVLGLGGAAVLVALGLWQVQRLDWKRGVLTDIETRIGAAPSAVPDRPDPVTDRYRPVRASGRIGAPTLRVLVSVKQVGAGHRLIVPFETDGRRILLDLGFLRQGRDLPPLPEGEISITGNLHWPDEVDAFTPDPQRVDNLWFARDVGAMARELGTEPVLVVRAGGGDIPDVAPLPIDTAGIPNDHLGYALTWFSLAVIWLAMTGVLVYRIRKFRGGAV